MGFQILQELLLCLLSLAPPVVRTADIVGVGSVNRRVNNGLVAITATLGAPSCVVIISAHTVNM